MKSREGDGGECTYVLDGLTSSILRWKEFCVGVAADTETVDELCILVSRVRGESRVRWKLTMVKRGAQDLIRRPSVVRVRCPTAVEGAVSKVSCLRKRESGR
jgi:hypothetical protein